MHYAREQMLSILQEFVQGEVLLKHSFAVESAMRAYAEKFGQDIEYWGAVGLLHDIDFELYPDGHPGHAPEMLRRYGFNEQFVTDVLSHARDWEQERTLLQRTLLALDELTGFIIACALVRPDKSLANLETKSVLKKMKDKTFARSVNRETILQSARALDVDLEEHIRFVASALAQ
jgi:putative nucleotidyltransferase with HDIG domain